MNYDECVEYMKLKHGTQKRLQGTPYYIHPLTVSNILKDKGYNLEYQIAGLFHDLLEDTNATCDEIKSLSNKDVLDAVILVTKEKDYNMDNYIDRISKNDMAKCIKLADRLHNLNDAINADIKFRKKYVKETKDYYIKLSLNTKFEKDIKDALTSLENSINE